LSLYDMIIRRSFEVRNRLGMHARAAAKLVETAAGFRSSVSLEYGGQEVDGKSLLDILTLGCPYGGRIEARIEGPDADKAALALERLFADKFGED